MVFEIRGTGTSNRTMSPADEVIVVSLCEITAGWSSCVWGEGGNSFSLVAKEMQGSAPHVFERARVFSIGRCSQSISHPILTHSLTYSTDLRSSSGVDM
jgi:hypothetical protein